MYDIGADRLITYKFVDEEQHSNVWHKVEKHGRVVGY